MAYRSAESANSAMRSGPDPGGSAANAVFVYASSSAIGNTGSARPSRARSSQSWYQPITVTRWPASSVPDHTPHAGSAHCSSSNPELTPTTPWTPARNCCSTATSGPELTSAPPVERLGADHVLGAEALELLPRDAERAQHVVGVLPERRGRTAPGDRGPGRQPHGPRRVVLR